LREMSTPRFNALLDRSSSHDKDERYMATSDLCAELQKDIKIDATMERRICSAVLKQLDDQSNDVQSIAVKCLGVLLKRVHKAQVGEIADKLCSLILDGKDELRDIYSIGLKTLVKDMPEENASVCEKLTKRLLAGAKQAKFDVKLEALDNLTDVLKRFGSTVSEDHEAILEVVLDQLAEKAVARKRAAFCLAALAACCSEQLLEELFGHLLKRLGKGSVEETRTSIQTIGTIARAVGGKLGRRLDAIVPVFVKHVSSGANSEETDEMNELRDNCFQGLESFVLRCPAEITPHLRSLVDVALQFSTYDPNYSYDDDDDAGGGGGAGENDDDDLDDGDDENDEDQYFEDYDDQDDDEDDDSSWKVRRAAVKLLTAIIASRREMLAELYEKVAPAIVDRFKEREENVRVDVVEAATTLLRATAKHDASSLVETHLEALTPKIVEACAKQIVRDGYSVKKFEQKQLALVSAGSTSGGQHAASKNEKSKAACYGLLRALCAVKSLEPFASTVAEAVRVGLSEKSQALRLDAARLLRAALDVDDASGGGIASRDVLVDKVASLVMEEWYKLIAEGLRLVASLARLRGSSALSARHAQVLYEAATSKLEAKDVDHEIKECAIEAAAALVANHGPGSDFLEGALGLVLEKARTESTRPAALKALGDIASSDAQVDVSSIAVQCVKDLASFGFTKYASRSLKQATLDTLQKIVDNESTWTVANPWDIVEAVLDEASNLVCDDDLHLAHLAMKLTVAAVGKPKTKTTTRGGKAKKSSPQEGAAGVAKARTFPAALTLLRSPLLTQGPALDALGDLLVAFATVLGPTDDVLGFAPAYAAVFDLADKTALASGGGGAASSSSQASDVVGGDSSNNNMDVDADANKAPAASSRADKQMLANAASALAALCAEADATQRAAKVDELVALVKGEESTPKQKKKKAPWARVRLATLALGELGKRVDLASSPAAFEALMAASSTTWKSSSSSTMTPPSDDDKDHKTSAALALGLVASGSVAAFLPPLLEALEGAADDDEYVLLAATKEVASAADPKALAPFVDRVADRLVRSADAEGEPTRAMVADCLGALAPIAPAAVAARLDALLDRRSTDPFPPPPKQQDDDEDVENSLANPGVRASWTAAAALKQASSSATHPAASFVEHVGPRLRRALDLVDDPKLDLAVRRQALVMLNACAHHRPSLIAPLVAEAVPKLRTVVDLKLERVVDLGPFKHKVDDGLPVRKAAIACVATFLDHAVVVSSSGGQTGALQTTTQSDDTTTEKGNNTTTKGTGLDADGDAEMTPVGSPPGGKTMSPATTTTTKVEASSFALAAPELVPIAVAALGDKSEDIQIVAHALVVKLAEVVPEAVAASVDALLEPLDKTVHKKISAKTGTEADRAFDLVRSGLKAALALANLPRAIRPDAVTAFLDKVNKKDKLATELLRLQHSGLGGPFEAPTPNAPASS